MLLRAASSVRRALIVLLFAVPAALLATDTSETFMAGFPPPDPRIVKAAQLGLEKYRDSRPYKDEWRISIDEQRGTLETNWFPEHKGEVKLRVQVAVWGESFSVDVWQKVGWLFSSVEKTAWSRRIERYIQNEIQAQIEAGL